MKKIYKNTVLKELRIKRGINQQELGKLIGKSHGSIGGYERERRPLSLKTATSIAKVLKTSKNKLFKQSSLDKNKFEAIVSE